MKYDREIFEGVVDDSEDDLLAKVSENMVCADGDDILEIFNEAQRIISVYDGGRERSMFFLWPKKTDDGIVHIELKLDCNDTPEYFHDNYHRVINRETERSDWHGLYDNGIDIDDAEEPKNDLSCSLTSLIQL